MNITKQLILTVILILPLIGFGQGLDVKHLNTNTEFRNDHPHKVIDYKQIESNKTPKNIILMIGDGMGLSHQYATLTANHGQLFIANMKYIGISKTQSADDYTTDSAAGGTAIATGKKTYNRAISVDTDTMPTPTFIEESEKKKKATGLVTTCSITDATPAVFFAHVPERSMYEDIAEQFTTSGIDLFIGGGSKYFAKRSDHKDLIKTLKDNGYSVAYNMEEAQSITSDKLSIFTNEGDSPPYTKRGDYLPQATEKAIEVLSNNSKEGFFLMVEGSQIDWGGHQNNISYIVNETLDFDRAVGKALEFAAKDGNTLVIVTADHETGGLAIETGDMKTGYVKAKFTTGTHTGLGVPVYTYGPCADHFIGFYENTEIYHKMAKLWKLE